MTDKEKLIELLVSFGVGFECEFNEIVCKQGAEKVGGYSGFVTSFLFSEDGTFQNMGAWEE